MIKILTIKIIKLTPIKIPFDQVNAVKWNAVCKWAVMGWNWRFKRWAICTVGSLMNGQRLNGVLKLKWRCIKIWVQRPEAILLYQKEEEDSEHFFSLCFFQIIFFQFLPGKFPRNFGEWKCLQLLIAWRSKSL